MPRLRYRLRQGLRALFAFAMPPDLQPAQQHLSDCEYAAFCRLSRADQLHSLTVLRALQVADAQTPPALLKAALLHDIGKSRYRLAVWQKTVAVLAQHLTRGRTQRAADDDILSPWRAPFIVRAQHARWGGDILRACGTDEAVIWLAEHHQRAAADLRDHPLHALLVALQRADNAS